MKLTSQAYYIKLSLLSLFNYIIILFNITKLTWQDGLKKTDVVYVSMELVTHRKKVLTASSPVSNVIKLSCPQSTIFLIS